jgi:hypothetical protein
MTLLSRLNSHSELVKKSFDIFREHYKNAFREVVITDIINGESLEIKPENILIHKNQKFSDEMFETKLKLCTKKLYNYQKNAIYKLRELELSGCVSHKHKKIISNGYLLSLPVGSDKSIVFLFLSIPQHEQLQWKYYPYFYENCGYIETDGNP